MAPPDGRPWLYYGTCPASGKRILLRSAVGGSLEAAFVDDPLQEVAPRKPKAE